MQTIKIQSSQEFKSSCSWLKLLSILQKPNYRGYMTRAELQKEAQPLCDASFTMVV